MNLRSPDKLALAPGIPLSEDFGQLETNPFADGATAYNQYLKTGFLKVGVLGILGEFGDSQEFRALTRNYAEELNSLNSSTGQDTLVGFGNNSSYSDDWMANRFHVDIFRTRKEPLGLVQVMGVLCGAGSVYSMKDLEAPASRCNEEYYRTQTLRKYQSPGKENYFSNGAAYISKPGVAILTDFRSVHRQLTFQDLDKLKMNHSRYRDKYARTQFRGALIRSDLDPKKQQRSTEDNSLYFQSLGSDSEVVVGTSR